MMKIALLVIFIFVILLIVFQPKNCEVELFTDIGTDSENVWNKMVEVSRQTEWRGDIKSVDLVDGNETNPQNWVEVPLQGPPIKFKTIQFQPKSIWTFSFENEVMTGTWLGSVKALEQNLTRVTIKERVKIHNPIFRMIFRLTSGLEKFAREYLINLKQVCEMRK